MDSTGYDIGPDEELRGMSFHHSESEEDDPCENSRAVHLERIKKRFPEGNVIGMPGVHAVPYCEPLDESTGRYLPSLHRGTSRGFYQNGTHSSDTELDKLVWDPSVYASEAKRLQSFRGWPYSSAPPSVRPEDLAKDGFWYEGPGDRVQCAFCGKCLARWVEGDIVHEEHKRLKPDCPFQCGKTNENVPLTVEERSAIVCDLMREDEACRKDQADDSKRKNIGSPQLLHTPMHPEYSDEATQLASYTNWPTRFHQKPADLSKAGLLYLNKPGSDDLVCCFFCGNTIFDWEEDDDPWMEHVTLFPKCHFIEQNQEYFVQRAKREK